jgi:hypothetical protein
LLDSPTTVTVEASEFSSAVHAEGPTDTYTLNYFDTQTNVALAATVSSAPTSAVVLHDNDNIVYDATILTGLINASSDGIGVGGNSLESTVGKVKINNEWTPVLTTESLVYNPGTTADTITVTFKETGSVGWDKGGGEDVLYLTLSGANAGQTQTIMLSSLSGDYIVNGDGTLTEMTTPYAGGPLTSYTIDTPSGWGGIDSVQVTAGFYTTTDHDGNPEINATSIKLGFGFSTEVVTTINHEVTMNFTADLTDGDGDPVSATFSVITEESGTIIGTDNDDAILYHTGNTIDGGSGVDTIILTTGADINFGVLDSSNNPITNIEAIDLSVNGAHQLQNISHQDILDITGGGTTLTILGDTAADTVTVDSSMSYERTSTEVFNGVSYDFDIYSSVSGMDPTVTLRVENIITDAII